MSRETVRLFEIQWNPRFLRSRAVAYSINDNAVQINTCLFPYNLHFKHIRHPIPYQLFVYWY